MSDAAMVWHVFLAAFAPAFTQPSLALWQALICGWVLCPGRRTVTRMVSVIDPTATHAHDAYHRLLRCGAWQMEALWRTLARKLIADLCPAGPVELDVDDTLFHKTGRKVEGAGIFRDPVRSTKNRVVYAHGLSLVVLTLRVTPPWGSMPLGLPINMRLHRKGGSTYVELAEEMIRQVLKWLPDRCLSVTGDGAYAGLAGKDLPRTHITTRMRSDAALFDKPPPRKKGQPGRPRKKGKRLPTPAKIARTKRGWRQETIDFRGKPVQRRVLRREVLWYGACQGRLGQLAIVRDPQRHEPDDFLFTTDTQANPSQVAARYAGRWSIEETFRNVKQFLGGHNPQTWKGEGPERAAALSLWVYSAVWNWYIANHGTKPSLPRTPWYPAKSTPSFADALAALRSVLWRECISANSHPTPLMPEITDTLIDILARAA